MMKRYLWIGSYATEEIAMQLKQLGYKNSASIVSQRNLLEGMEKVTGKVFDSIGTISLSGYPNQKVICLDEIKFKHKLDANDVLVGYLNIKYLNKIFSQKALAKKTRLWTKNAKEDDIHIFIYEMRSACLAAAIEIKKVVPSTKIHLIVPDLPQYMDLSMNTVKKVFKYLDWKKICNYLKYVDDYILYAKPMADYLGIKDKRWMVIEGSINSNEIKDMIPVQSNTEKIIVMYSGSLQMGFKIENLLKAFKYLNDDFELWLTGGGTAEKLVQKYAEKDSRIKYYGYLPTRDELKKLQYQATMFVNMRDPEVAASDYCFPSKLFEYMLMGKPVLSCRLGGIPEEYFNYLFEMKSIEPKDIAEAIRTVSKRKDKVEIGVNTREFVVKEKNNIVQANKIIQFVEGSL